MLVANLFYSRTPHIYGLPLSATILLVVWSAKGDDSALTSKASSKVNLLNYDTYDGLVLVLEVAFLSLQRG